MRSVCGFRDALIYFVSLWIQMDQYSAVLAPLSGPLNWPIFDMIFQKMNNFNESIHDTSIFFKKYDFVIIGSGSGKPNGVLIGKEIALNSY